MDQEDCQICLLPVSQQPLLYTRCHHCACKNCFEKILLPTGRRNISLIRSEYESHEKERIEDAIVASCPGWGRCPFCRNLINLFELTNSGENKVFHKNIDALAGAIFRDRERKIKIEFPASGALPCVYIREGSDEQQLFFDDGFYYHDQSKIFHGIIDFRRNDSLNKSNKNGTWEWIMQFSSDFRYVIHGVIVQRPLEISSIEECPLAGKWIVRWQHVGQQGVDRNDLNAARIFVRNNSYTYLGQTYELSLGDDEEGRVHFAWPGYGILQVAESGIDLRTKSGGPDVGDTIVWTVDHPDYFRIFWTRETKGHLPPSVQIKQMRNLRMEQFRQIQKPLFHSGSPWGNVFIQCNKVGVASYHFIPADIGEYGAYISYEHFECLEWGPLDDGSPIPSRVPFEDTSYDPITRTFRGMIPWLERYGACWHRFKSWYYEIVFDSEFLCILSGGVRCVVNEDLEDRSQYGENLNYINAAIVHRIKSAVEANTEIDGTGIENDASNEGNDDTSVRQRSLATRTFIRKMIGRLEDENVPPRTLSLLTNAGSAAFNDELDNIDYNL